MNQALQKEAIIISGVRGELFGIQDCEVVATYVAGADQESGIVRLYAPPTDDVRDVAISVFVEAWEAAGGRCTTAFPPDSKTYRPKLISLNYVELPEGFNELREAIAENAHDMWALERQSEGWTYGPQRDDTRNCRNSMPCRKTTKSWLTRWPTDMQGLTMTNWTSSTAKSANITQNFRTAKQISKILK